MERELTQKQANFTRLIFEGMSQRNAYIEAYHPTYSISSIDENASRLSSNEKVKARLEILNARADDSSIAKAKELKQILTEIVRGRLGDFVDVDGELIKVDKDSLRNAALQEIRVTHFVGVKMAELARRRPL